MSEGCRSNEVKGMGKGNGPARSVRHRSPTCRFASVTHFRIGSALALGLLLSARPPVRLSDLFAQCPDGTPPPCAGTRPRASAPSPNSVAVLYFENTSRDSADDYLAGGLTEEVILRLQQVRRLEVKSRYESQRVRG